MIRELESPPAPTVTGLVRDILRDVQELVRQQLALFKHEIKDSLRKSKEAAVMLGAGIGVAAAGGVLLCFMLVYLLNWAFALPLWICFLIVGVVCCAVGGGMLYAGIKKLQSVTVAEQSIDALKENVQWIRNPR
jgi:hypothetical protein